MAKNQVILTSLNEQGIDRDIVEHLQNTFGSKSVSLSLKDDVIESISLPREKFLKELKRDSALRSIIRSSESNIQEVFAKPLALGEKMEARVFVHHAKTVGITKRDGNAVPVGDNLERLRETLSEWGQVKIPALILLALAGGTLYGAFRLARVAQDIASGYAAETEAAIKSEQGLERAVQRRAGKAQAGAPEGNAGTASTKPKEIEPPPQSEEPKKH